MHMVKWMKQTKLGGMVKLGWGVICIHKFTIMHVLTKLWAVVQSDQSWINKWLLANWEQVVVITCFSC